MLFSNDALPPVEPGAPLGLVPLARAPATAESQTLARIQQMALVPGTKDSFAVLDTNGRVSVLRGTAFRETPLLDLRAGDPVTAALAFNPDAGPGDADYGLLHFTAGDGGGATDPLNAAQRLDQILGKLLRIDPLARGDAAFPVPGDNPFAETPGALPEILAYGFRNPQQISFAGGQIFLGEIGQHRIEEIDVSLPGGNYGWDLRVGIFATAPHRAARSTCCPPGRTAFSIR